MSTPTMTLPEKVVDFIGYADAALEKAAEFQQQVSTKQKAAEALIPAAVEALVANERIQPTEKAKAAEVLKDPVQVLEILTKVASHRNPAELSTLGTPVNGNGTKVASANGQSYDPAASLTNPNVGARTTRVKQSDVVYLRALGLEPPTE